MWRSRAACPTPSGPSGRPSAPPAARRCAAPSTGLLHGLRRRPGLCRRARPRLEEPAAGGPRRWGPARLQDGDSVQHKAFGRGLITKVTPMGRRLVEIAFDSVGTKKLMLKSASQYMKKV